MILAIAIIAGCSSKDEQPAMYVDVHLLFSHDGFCNVGYNDMILNGIEKISRQYGFNYSFYVPDSIESGMENYREWRRKPLEDDCEKSLFIFTSNIYEELLSQEEHPDPQTGKEILIFETENEVPYAYSFGMSYYGATYMASRTYEHLYDVIASGFDYNIIAANPYIYGLDHITDGLQACIEENATGTSSIQTTYLSYVKGGGLDDQNVAYMNCVALNSLESENHKMYVPLAGMSNLGVYRHIIQNLTPGMGVDFENKLESAYLAISMYKRFDLAFSDFFELWLKGEEVPRRRFYTMESGRIDMGFIYKEKYPYPDLDSLWNIAVEKEQQYFKSKGN